MKKLKTLMPVLVLGIICLVVTGALAAGFQVTDPIIQEANAAAEAVAKAEVLPGAGAFSEIALDGMPATVTSIEHADGVGYVIKLTTKGYGGKMKLILGLDESGVITGVKALDLSNETQGVGTKVGTEAFYGQFIGKDGSLDGVETITGATISSSAYLNAVKDAFTAFDMISGKEGA